MSISLDEVRHVARLARLDLNEGEVIRLQGELNALIGHFADIQGVDVTGVDAQSHAVMLQNVWAEDIPQPTLARDRALKNAPLSKAGLFLVPQILED
ncbi:MAG: Asp-tRNA(Asn)/Glu-tRNA(Gln) amidotransferase subunit GatC [Fimbriimonas sp.]